MKPNALARARKPRWQQPQPQALLGLVQVTSDATRDGMIRAANLHHFLRSSVVTTLRGSWELWRALMAHPSLMLRKCPREKVEVFEEYRSLHEAQLFSTLLRK